MNLDTRPERTYFEVNFLADQKALPVMRRFVVEICRSGPMNQHLADRIALGAHELIENAISYSMNQEVRFSIELVGSSADPIVRLRVTNQSTAEHIVRLNHFFEDMKAYPDPAAQYQHLMRLTATQSEGPGLGLGRIRAEANLALWHEIKELEVTVTAQTRRSSGEVP